MIFYYIEQYLLGVNVNGFLSNYIVYGGGFFYNELWEYLSMWFVFWGKQQIQFLFMIFIVSENLFFLYDWFGGDYKERETNLFYKIVVFGEEWKKQLKFVFYFNMKIVKYGVYKRNNENLGRLYK